MRSATKKNAGEPASLRPASFDRPVLRAADAVHWRGMALCGVQRPGARLRVLAGTLLARQRSAAAASVVAKVIALPLPTAPSPRVLRVLHVVDGGGGRMVISGRMADVCAELDRLAAASEARQARC